jgi:tellurite resistance protein
MNPLAMQRLIDELLVHFPAGDAGLIALVDLTVLVAIADGHIDGAEMAALTESIEAMVGSRLEPSLVEHLVTESVAQIRTLGAEASARDIGEVLAAHHAGEEGVRLALAIGLASEGLSASELERIGEVAHAAGVSAARLDELIAAPT